MKPATAKYAKRTPRPSAKRTAVAPLAAAPEVKPKKRDNIFSKSRDTREDRSTRQMTASRNAQTFPHGQQ